MKAVAYITPKYEVAQLCRYERAPQNQFQDLLRRPEIDLVAGGCRYALPGYD